MEVSIKKYIGNDRIIKKRSLGNFNYWIIEVNIDIIVLLRIVKSNFKYVIDYRVMMDII